MANCWTCGSSVSGYHHTCSSCENAVREIKNLRGAVSEGLEDISEGIEELSRIQEAGFRQLSGQLSGIASILEWGFEDLRWQLEQQTDILRSIDNTLKTPSETKANEWRLHAEELKRRGVLDESEEFFLKALNEYRLDYRTYFGLAETYIRIREFDKAEVFLEKSLPHAPKKEIDWRSNSYRLIGHIYACREDYGHAMEILRSSVELSPTYTEGHYDYAQYCAQTRTIEPCLLSLEQAVLAKPLYWYLTQKERNFDPARTDVEKLLLRLNTEASNEAKDAIAEAEDWLEKAHEVVSEATMAVKKFLTKSSANALVLNSSPICEKAEQKLKLAKDKVELGDYKAFLEAKPIADEASSLAKSAINTARDEQEHYQRKRKEKIDENLFNFILLPFWGGVGGALVGAIVAVAIAGIIENSIGSKWPPIAYFVVYAAAGIFIIAGIVISIIIIKHELKLELESQHKSQDTEANAEFDIVLVAVGDKKIQVINEVKNIIGFDLEDVKNLVEGVPITIKQEVNKNEATRLKAQLEAVGATVEIRKFQL